MSKAHITRTSAKRSTIPDRRAVAPLNIYSGAVAGQASLRMNEKGGSRTVILRKALAEMVQIRGSDLDAAAVKLANGSSFLLMGSEENMGGHVHVEQTGRNRVELVFGEDDGLEIDAVTEAFINLKLALFTSGRLAMTDPVTTEDLEQMSLEEDAEYKPGRQDSPGM